MIDWPACPHCKGTGSFTLKSTLWDKAKARMVPTSETHECKKRPSSPEDLVKLGRIRERRLARERGEEQPYPHQRKS